MATHFSWDFKTNQMVRTGFYPLCNYILGTFIGFLFTFLMLVNWLFKYYSEKSIGSVVTFLLAIAEAAIIFLISTNAWHSLNERDNIQGLTNQLLRFDVIEKGIFFTLIISNHSFQPKPLLQFVYVLAYRKTKLKLKAAMSSQNGKISCGSHLPRNTYGSSMLCILFHSRSGAHSYTHPRFN